MTVIHIGMPKAASTFLQKDVFTHENGFYPLGRYGVGGKHCIDDVAEHFIREGLFDEDYVYKNSHADYRGHFSAHQQKAASDGLVPVISHEKIVMRNMGACPFEERLKRLHDCIGPDSRIVVVLRNQAAWLQSFYYTLVCNIGAWNSVDYFIGLNFSRPSHPFSFISTLDYHYLLKSVSDYFDNVKVLFFEDFQASPGTFMQELCDFVNVAGINYPEEKQNASGSDQHMQDARKFNYRFTQGVSRSSLAEFDINQTAFITRTREKAKNGEPLTTFEKEALMDTEKDRKKRSLTLNNPQALEVFNNSISIESLPGSVRMAEEQHQEVLAYFEPSNRALAEALGRDLGSLGYFPG